MNFTDYINDIKNKSLKDEEIKWIIEDRKRADFFENKVEIGTKLLIESRTAEGNNLPEEFKKFFKIEMAREIYKKMRNMKKTDLEKIVIKGGYQIVTPNPPPTPKYKSKKWGTKVP